MSGRAGRPERHPDRSGGRGRHAVRPSRRAGVRPAVMRLLRVLSPSLAIVATLLLTTGAWAMDTLIPGAIIGAALCLLLLAPVIWSRRRSAGRLDAVRELERRLSEVAASGWGLRVAEPREGGRSGEIARLTRTVNGLLDREEQTVARQRQFASDASHELRTPIAGLRTNIEVALSEPGCTDPDGTLRDALRDVERLHQITEDLLVLARLDAGPQPERTRVNLTGLVRDALEARTAGVPVDDRLEDDVYVDVNGPQIGRAVVNLLSNAERYADGGVEVTLETDADDAVLEVRDDGPGIAADDRERVFDRFTRLDTARSRDRGGTGLGLPVAREIVAAHGGRLNVAQSERGARLVLRLPLYRPPGEDDPDRAERGTFRPPTPSVTRPRRR